MQKIPREDKTSDKVWRGGPLRAAGNLVFPQKSRSGLGTLGRSNRPSNRLSRLQVDTYAVFHKYRKVFFLPALPEVWSLTFRKA
jgi:hypothetical protein